MYHYTFRGTAADNLSERAFPLLAEIFKYGYLGVDLFFMISGFVILMSLQNKSVSQFALARAIRLYPPFWVCVSITSLFIYLSSDIRFAFDLSQYLFNMTMLAGVFYVPYIDGVYWTLLIELKFYVLVACVLAIFGQRVKQGFLYAWLFYTGLAIYFEMPEKLNYVLIPSWSTYFISGAIFYLIYANKATLDKIFALILSYLIAIYQARELLVQLNEYYQGDIEFLIVVLIISSAYLALASIALKRADVINQRIFYAVGGLTYPLYLLHQNIGYIMFNTSPAWLPNWLVLIFTIALVFLIAALVHHYIEIKLGNFIKRIVFPRSASAKELN
ncbi:acyltransferase family protein [Gayadomonas joobiniege]|uniref:acyltransferase family protein n=1 Tax=Gayadomonas joobiniege TaxID=1234606 RepID=UPI001ED9A3A0|nr:acyltransferase [Gayadomonas joobiniege]